jgi:hypothetical protein
VWDNDSYTPSQLIAIAALLLAVLFTPNHNYVYAETSPEMPKCNQSLAADWLKKIDEKLIADGYYPVYGQYQWDNILTKGVLLKTSSGSVNRIILFNAGMTLTVTGVPPSSVNLSYANNTTSSIATYDVRPSADGSAFTIGSASTVGPGVTIDYNNVTCIDQIKGTVSQYATGFPGTLNDLWPGSPGRSWNGLNFTQPIPPAPEPNTELTLRDQKLIALTIVGFLTYLITKPFIFRQHE